MKKFLIATTALVATTGMAVADVKLSGYGRFGLDYRGDAAATASKTSVNMRMRVNIDGSVETDSGVVFGGRIRMQYSAGGRTTIAAAAAQNTGATLNAAQLYATYNGMRLEVGNANSAIDSVALMYNSEIGYLDRGFGDPIGGFTAYNSTPAGADNMGIFFGYSFGDGNVRISYNDPNQTTKTLPVGTQEEISISGDYKFGQFTVAAAYADNSGFVDGNTSLFLGAEYAINSDANVGLLYFRNDTAAPNTDNTRITLYGNYKSGAITYKGYIARDDAFGAPGTSKTALGVGLDYDLGGARLAADIHRSYTKDTIAGVGVRFNF